MGGKFWTVVLDGFDAHDVEAETAAKAKWRDFVAYEDAGFGRRSGDWSTKSERFKRFLDKVVRVHRSFSPSPVSKGGEA